MRWGSGLSRVRNGLATGIESDGGITLFGKLANPKPCEKSALGVVGSESKPECRWCHLQTQCAYLPGVVC